MGQNRVRTAEREARSQVRPLAESQPVEHPRGNPRRIAHYEGKQPPTPQGTVRRLGIVHLIHQGVLPQPVHQPLRRLVDGQHPLAHITRVGFQHRTVGITQQFLEFGLDGRSQPAGRGQSAIPPGTPGQHIPLPAEVLGQARDADIRPRKHILVHNRRERVIHHQVKTVLVGQAAQSGQVGTGQQRIGGDFAKQGADGGFAQLPLQSRQIGGIATREEQMSRRGEPLLDLQRIHVREPELGRGAVRIQPPNRPPHPGDRSHS